MERMRKLASILIALSLFVSPLAYAPARASQSAASDALTASGESELEPPDDGETTTGTASVSGAAVDGGDTPIDDGETTTGTTSGDATVDGGDTPIDDGETTTGTTSGGATADNGETPIDDGETTTGTASGGATADNGDTPIDDGETSPDGGASETPDEEEEEAAEGETPEEEETASSGLKEGAPDGGDSEPEPALPFDDVPSDHWSYPFVLYAYEHDLVKGVSETAFNPTGVMTRAAFVTVLYRLSPKIGADMSTAPTAFADIGDINSEFQAAIAWAAAHGIVNGRTETTFAPRENIMRQQMCAILVRYLQDYLRYDLSAYQGDANFADGDSISNYAKNAVSIVQGMGIISGREVDGATVFAPTDSASRAAVVKVLSLAVQMIPDLQKAPDEPPADTGDSGNSTDTGDSGDSGNSTDTGDSGSSSDTGDSGNSSSTGNSGNHSSSGGHSSNGGSGSGGGNTSSHGGGNTSSHGGGNTSSNGGGNNTKPNNGDSGNSDTGDSGDSGDSGNSDTGDSGDSGDSGNSDTGDSGDSGDSGHTESPETAVIFGYIDEILEAYEANPPTSAFVKSCMDILIPDLRAIKAAREAGEIVDSEYLRTHFPDDIQKLRTKYSLSTVGELLELMDYAEKLGPDRSHFMAILDYFQVMNMLQG